MGKKNKIKTPRIMPGGVYLTYTSDTVPRPVYASIQNCEPDVNGKWGGMLLDQVNGMQTYTEGDAAFSFYALVESPVLDRDNPKILESGDAFLDKARAAKLAAERVAELKKTRELNARRASSGGGR